MNKLKAAILALGLILPCGQEALGKKTLWIVPLLHFAVKRQVNAEKMQELIDDEDADIHARSPKGETALHWAARGHQNPEVLDILIDAGAEVDARSNTGFTPLHYAARSKNPRGVVPALLDAGVDPNRPVKQRFDSLAFSGQKQPSAGGLCRDPDQGRGGGQCQGQ